MPSGKHKQTPKKLTKEARPLDPQQELWLRQPDESEEAYEAFSLYRDLGMERSQVRVADQLGKSTTLINRWGSQWSWVVRARAWDNEQDRLTLERNAREAAAMRVRQARGAAIVGRALTAPAEALLRELQADPDLLVRGLRTANGELRHDRLVELMGMVVASARMMPPVAQVERIARGVDDQQAAAVRDRIDPREHVRDLMSDSEAREMALRLFERMNGYAEMPGRLPPSVRRDLDDEDL